MQTNLSALEAFLDLPIWLIATIVAVPIAIVIVTTLFLMQKHGTAFVGKFFGPITLLWFLSLGILGIVSVIQTPVVLGMVSPHWAIQFNNFFKSLLPFKQASDLPTNHLKNLLTWRQTNPEILTAAKLAMPSPEHYLPALYILGVKYPNESCQVITDGIEMASISMLSFGLGLNGR